MALTANALTTLATVKTELGISDSSKDAVLERLIAAASDAIEAYCSRVFGRATVTELVAGLGTQRLLVSRTPIESVTSISIDGSTVTASTYSVENDKAGVIYRESGWPWSAEWAQRGIDGLYSPAGADRLPGTERRLVSVTYVAGYVLPKDTPGQGQTRLPYDIEQACIDAVVQAYRNRGKYSNLQTETEAQEDVTWRGHVIPGPARKALDRHRRVV